MSSITDSDADLSHIDFDKRARCSAWTYFLHTLFSSIYVSFSLSSRHLETYRHSDPPNAMCLSTKGKQISLGSSLARARSCRPVPAGDKEAPKDHNRRLVSVRWIFPNLPFRSSGPPANNARREQVNPPYLPEGMIPSH